MQQLLRGADLDVALRLMDQAMAIGSASSASTSPGARSSKVRCRSAPSSAVRSRTLVQR